MKVLIKPQDAEKKTISVEDVSNLQNTHNFSLRTTKGIVSFVKNVTGNKQIFERGVISKLVSKNHNVDNYFQVEKLEFIYSKATVDTSVTEPLVYCNDLMGYINYIKERRQITDKNVHLKIGTDGGGGFFKVCLSMQLIDNEEKKCEKECFKDSGVKKMFLIAVAPIQENYHNVNKIWQKLNLNNLLKNNATISTDLKLANLLCGIGTHASKFPCTWCTAENNQLHSKGAMRSISNIKANYTSYSAAGSNPKKAKDFDSCINMPVFHEITDKRILDLLPPPELHLMLGAVNSIISHICNDEHCKKDADEWIKECYVERKVTYHGCSLEGNSCKKLLNSLDSLRSKKNIFLMKYVQLLEDLKNVIHDCFGNYLEPTFDKSIEKFRQNYLSSGLSVTPKIHAIFFHVLDFCQEKSHSLGFYSEQAVESIHHDFNTIWSNYLIKNRKNPRYDNSLLKAIQQFNARHS